MVNYKKIPLLSCGMIALLMSGCYYWRPILVVSPNTPPEILYSDPPFGDVMQLSLSTSNSAFVVVQDLDTDDNLRFQWYISGSVILGTGETLSQDGFEGSKLVFSNVEASWHNRTLTCIVFDSSNESATISWPIEILEEN